MIEYIALYFGINLILTIVIWLCLRPKKVSAVGYTIAMMLFGIVLVATLLILFVVALLIGGSYSLGRTLEKWFEGR